eukprot:5032213-Pleurochrysis_carterae.AAC.1
MLYRGPPAHTSTVSGGIWETEQGKRWEEDLRMTLYLPKWKLPGAERQVGRLLQDDLLLILICARSSGRPVLSTLRVPLSKRRGYGTEATLRECSRSTCATTRSRPCASR